MLYDIVILSIWIPKRFSSLTWNLLMRTCNLLWETWIKVSPRRLKTELVVSHYSSWKSCLTWTGVAVTYSKRLVTYSERLKTWLGLELVLKRHLCLLVTIALPKRCKAAAQTDCTKCCDVCLCLCVRNRHTERRHGFSLTENIIY